MEYFANNIKFLRKKHNLIQPEIKDILDIEPTTWSGYERGKSYPNLKLFHKICEYFQVPETDMLNTDLSKGKVMGGHYKENIDEKGKVKGKVTGKVTEDKGPPDGDNDNLLELLQGKDIIIQSQSKTIATLEAFNEHLQAQLSALTGQLERLKKEVPSVNKGMEDTHKPSGKKRSA